MNNQAPSTHPSGRAHTRRRRRPNRIGPSRLRRRGAPLAAALAVLLVAITTPPPLLAAPSTLRPATPIAPALAPGDTGPLVAALQRTLRNAGYAISVTGSFNQSTSRAWRSFASASLLPRTITSDTLTRLGVDTLAASVWVPLTRSSSRTRVRALQTALNATSATTPPTEAQASLLPTRPLVVDGRLGPHTTHAYQSWHTATFGTEAPLPLVVDEPAAVRLGLFTPPPPSFRFEAFPLAVPCFFAATFGHPRPGARRHEGVDLIAAELSPVLAPFPGVITRLRPDSGSISGNSLRVTALDGSYVFYAHLASFAPGVQDGTPVKAGQVVGFLGRTGTTTPHLHLEWHPQAGPAVDPFPLLVRSGSCTP